MNEYPEWLVDKVARILANAAGDEDPEEGLIWWPYIEDASATLDALGFAPWGGPTYWRSDIQWEAK